MIRMQKNKIILLIIAILVAITMLILLMLGNQKEENNTAKEDKVETKEENKVTAGSYTLVNAPTTYQRELFDELKDILDNSEATDQELAQILAKNFIAEFYTLSNVTSKDVRGTQFVPEVLRNRFVEYGNDIYNYYQYYTNRKDLEVTEITITNTKSIQYNYVDDLKQVASKSNLSGYEITMNWTYKDDSDYTTKVTIVKWDNNYSIVKVEN